MYWLRFAARLASPAECAAHGIRLNLVRLSVVSRRHIVLSSGERDPPTRRTDVRDSTTCPVPQFNRAVHIICSIWTTMHWGIPETREDRWTSVCRSHMWHISGFLQDLQKNRHPHDAFRDCKGYSEVFGKLIY